jgi:hypothetical protein
MLARVRRDRLKTFASMSYGSRSFCNWFPHAEFEQVGQSEKYRGNTGLLIGNRMVRKPFPTTHDLAILRLDGITCSRLLAGHFKNLCSPSDGAIPAG